MHVLDTFQERMARLRRRVHATRRAVDDMRTQATAALEQLGVRPRSTPAGAVVDVVAADAGVGGAVRGLLRRTGQAMVLMVSAALLGAALWSLGIFMATSLLAFVIVTRGLGLRVDLGPQAA
jgi:hypothetical protein